MSSTITIIVRNVDAIDHQWGGYVYGAGTSTLTEDVDRLRLLSDPVFLADYASGLGVINDGNYDLVRRVGLGLLQNSNQILTEYYTLVSDDDVLVGNGQILQLYDDLWMLEGPGES